MNTSVWNRTSTPAINCMRKLQRNSRDYQKRSTARRCGVYCLRSFLREQSSALFLVMILYCCIRHVQHYFVVIVNSWFYIIYWEGSVSMPLIFVFLSCDHDMVSGMARSDWPTVRIEKVFSQRKSCGAWVCFYYPYMPSPCNNRCWWETRIQFKILFLVFADVNVIQLLSERPAK